ncbi:hypothetical protein SAMN05216570_1236 [Dyella sp. OK004]|uniref:hypothetical protein n=1 Tax=Dyella sp. OK004 TaxID=1855292 RepID=UPI0008EBBAE0|nr:hypothetical protein [Dyella sp. OK004]SFR95659.1 hypothetical protein SAMN05216570_1236 [Dyella sp. OK004]
MRKPASDNSRHYRLLAGALLWLLAGGALLLTTLVPVRTDLLGWTPAFWLVGAPLALLLVLEPSLPRQLLSLLRGRRRRVPHAIWH